MIDEPIDEAAFEELLANVGGDREFVVELIQSFLADSPPIVASMQAAAAAGDAAALRRTAHLLKSTSGSLGALRLAAACRAVEHAAEGGEVRADLVADAADGYARASAALGTWADGA